MNSGTDGPVLSLMAASVIAFCFMAVAKQPLPVHAACPLAKSSEPPPVYWQKAEDLLAQGNRGWGWREAGRGLNGAVMGARERVGRDWEDGGLMVLHTKSCSPFWA